MYVCTCMCMRMYMCAHRITYTLLTHSSHHPHSGVIVLVELEGPQGERRERGGVRQGPVRIYMYVYHFRCILHHHTQVQVQLSTTHIHTHMHINTQINHHPAPYPYPCSRPYPIPDDALTHCVDVSPYPAALCLTLQLLVTGRDFHALLRPK